MKKLVVKVKILLFSRNRDGINALVQTGENTFTCRVINFDEPTDSGVVFTKETTIYNPDGSRVKIIDEN